MRIHPILHRTLPGFIAACLMLSACGRENRLRGGIPSLALKTYDGTPFPISAQDGVVTLLVFWATWCQPCIMEMPSLIALHEKYRDVGFRVVGINIDDPAGTKALPIMRRMGVNYPMLVGNDETTRQFGGVNALPTSFLIGKDGKIKEKIQGLLPGYLLEEKVTAIF